MRAPALVVLAFLSPAAVADRPLRPAEKGVVRFEPAGDQRDVPERYRLAARDFPSSCELAKRVAEQSPSRLHAAVPVAGDRRRTRRTTPSTPSTTGRRRRPVPRRDRARHHRRRPEPVAAHRHAPGPEPHRRAVRADGLLRPAPAAGQQAAAAVAQRAATRWRRSGRRCSTCRRAAAWLESRPEVDAEAARHHRHQPGQLHRRADGGDGAAARPRRGPAGRRRLRRRLLRPPAGGPVPQARARRSAARKEAGQG